MPTDIIQVALVDDHRLFRSGMASLIGNLSGYNVMLEAGNGKEFIEKIGNKFKPDIAILDINMPVMDGFATIEWLNANHPEINVIVLSMYQDAEKVINLVRMGIKGYLLKDAEPQEFKEALDTVADNEVYYPHFVTKHLISNLTYKAEDTGIKLNEREKEFLTYIGTELTYKEIAKKMCVSARTVDGYRDALFEKLQIKSRVGLVIFAIKNKLLEF